MWSLETGVLVKLFEGRNGKGKKVVHASIFSKWILCVLTRTSGARLELPLVREWANSLIAPPVLLNLQRVEPELFL